MKPRHIILAFDSYKGSAGSALLSQTARQVIQEVLPSCRISVLEVADGGEGFAHIMGKLLHAGLVSCTARRADGIPMKASYHLTDDHSTAIMDIAEVCGFKPLGTIRPDTYNYSSYGLGQMMLHAMQNGARRIIIGLGGSITTDAAIGLLSALGVRFYQGKQLITDPKTCDIAGITSIDATTACPTLHETEVIMACDVDNMLCGKHGAAHTFGAQKGATPQQITLIDSGHRHLSQLIMQHFGIDITRIKGGGAAGGIAAGCTAFMPVNITSGTSMILETQNFDHLIQDADLIITGEGCSDRQTVMGKAPYHILKHAAPHGIPVMLLSGQIRDTGLLNEAGFTATFAIHRKPYALQEAMDEAYTCQALAQTLRQILHVLLA